MKRGISTRRVILAGSSMAMLSLTACGGARSDERGPEPMAEPAVPVPGSPVTRSAALPPTPAVDGPLDIQVVYPPEGASIAVRDSTFVFGSTGTGQAQLTINGIAVPVAANGAFLAFVPVPADGLYRLQATAGARRDTLLVRVDVPPPPAAASVAATILPGSVYPGGAWAVLPDERIEVGFGGTSGGVARLVLPDGERVRLVEQPGGDGIAEYTGFFEARRVVSADTSIGWPALASLSRGAAAAEDVREAEVDADPEEHGDAEGEAVRQPIGSAQNALQGAARGAYVELVLGRDTVREPLPLNMVIVDPSRPRVGVVDDPAPITERGDGQVVARPGPGGGPYHYFWPDGTELAITGERYGQYRVRLTDDLTVWSPGDEIRLAPAGTPPPWSRVSNVQIRPRAEFIEVRMPMSRRLPFRVDEREGRVQLDVYGALSRTNRVDYGELDPFVERAEWDQPNDELYRFTLFTNGWSWGHDVFHDGNTLVLRVRRPPAIDPDAPLRGRVIAIDAGHGGEAKGAVGPTGLAEAEVTLAVARRIAARLEDAGARPILVRDRNVDIALEERVQIATDAGAELLVSVHMDAFGDGVNPYENAGSHMFYNHPRAADLARHLQQEVLEELGLPDRGINRADLALARPTWMPSILSESVFMMVPQWEAALRDPEVIDRLAEAHVRGIADFLRQRAEE